MAQFTLALSFLQSGYSDCARRIVKHSNSSLIIEWFQVIKSKQWHLAGKCFTIHDGHLRLFERVCAAHFVVLKMSLAAMKLPANFLTAGIHVLIF
jgi:hypothetical protein